MSFDDSFDGANFGSSSGDWGDSPVTQPPKYVLPAAIVSILLGLALGVYGEFFLASATSQSQVTFGLGGYVFALIIPIVLLQLLLKNHNRQMKDNPHGYNIHGGIQTQKFLRKVVGVGMLAASLPIWLLVTPLAEKFVA